MFAPGSGSVVVVAVALLVVVAALASPAGRRAAVAALGSVGGWPALIRAGAIVFAFSFGAWEVPVLLGQSAPTALPVLAWQRFTDPDLAAREIEATL